MKSSNDSAKYYQWLQVIKGSNTYGPINNY